MADLSRSFAAMIRKSLCFNGGDRQGREISAPPLPHLRQENPTVRKVCVSTFGKIPAKGCGTAVVVIAQDAPIIGHWQPEVVPRTPWGLHCLASCNGCAAPA